MKVKTAISLLLLAPLLGGCALQAALAAREVYNQYTPEPERPNLEHLEPVATQACTRQAAQHGSVYIVDVSQNRANRLVVWGSVTDARQHRRTFECHYTNKVVSFRMYEIAA